MGMSDREHVENDADEYPEPDALDERWFVADPEQWAEVVRLIERAPEPKPRLADLLRERGMFASQHTGPPIRRET
jgi:hypothetical protein